MMNLNDTHSGHRDASFENKIKHQSLQIACTRTERRRERIVETFEFFLHPSDVS